MFCPQCGQPSLQTVQVQREFRCVCGFHFFLNVALGVAAIIQCGEHILVTRRAGDPGKGMLDFPGGFVEPAESMAQGLCRELAEELGLVVTPDALRWIGSAPNIYPYDGVTYHTCDGYFHLQLATRPALTSMDDVASFAWLLPAEIDPATFAFDSSRSGWQQFLAASQP